MTKLVVFTLAAAVVLLCSTGTHGKGGSKIDIPPEKADIFDAKFRSSLTKNLPPAWAGQARRYEAAIECGIHCFDPEGVCAPYQDGVRNCIQSTFKKLTKGRKSISPNHLMKGKRFFVPCIRETKIEKDSECTGCMKECLKLKKKH